MGSPFDFSTMFMTYMSVTLQLFFSEFYFIHDSFQSVVLLLISVQPARYVFKQILLYKGQRNPNSNSGLWAHGCNDAESPFSKLRCWAGHFKSDQTLIQKVPEQIPIYLSHFRKLHSPLIAKSWKLAWNLVIWEQTERGLGQKHKCYHAHPPIAVLHRSQNDQVSNADLLGHNTTLKRRNVGSPMMRHASGEKKNRRFRNSETFFAVPWGKKGHRTPCAVEGTAQVLSETVYSFSDTYRKVSSSMNTNYYKHYQ